MKSDKISRQPRANAEVRQSFRRVPELTVKTTRGQSILLACEVDNQEGPAQWLKDNSYIFHSNRTRAKTTEFDHIKIAGNGTDGDHSLIVENASEKDTGHYECQVMGKDDNGHEIWAASDVVVLPPPPMPIITELSSSSSSSSPSALSSDQSLSSSSINTTNELNMLTRQAPNEQHQTRIVVKATHLPSSAFISPSHASSNAHPTVASTTIGPAGAHLVISWPYILLLIAALLVMANIYLIYSLIKRHQRKKDNSLESASSGSAGTGSSRIETTEQPNSSPLEFYTSSPSVLITSGSSSVGACNYNNVVPVPPPPHPPHPPTPSCGGSNVSGPNGPTFQPANVGYAAPILHGTAYHLPGSWVLEC